jgi:hypothetical protein
MHRRSGRGQRVVSDTATDQRPSTTPQLGRYGHNSADLYRQRPSPLSRQPKSQVDGQLESVMRRAGCGDVNCRCQGAA